MPAGGMSPHGGSGLGGAHRSIEPFERISVIQQLSPHLQEGLGKGSDDTLRMAGHLPALLT